jgi:hypothetical protein
MSHVSRGYEYINSLEFPYSFNRNIRKITLANSITDTIDKKFTELIRDITVPSSLFFKLCEIFYKL